MTLTLGYLLPGGTLINFNQQVFIRVCFSVGRLIVLRLIGSRTVANLQQVNFRFKNSI